MIEFSDNNVVRVISIPIKVTEFDIENIITSSFEGGSNHWMGIDNSQEEWKNKPANEPLSTWATKILIEGDFIKLYDIEEIEDSSNWVLTMNKLFNGIKQNAIERPFDADLKDMDGTTADCIIQYSLFERVIYQ